MTTVRTSNLTALEWSVCSCLTQLILFVGRGVFTLLPKVQLHVSALDNSHLHAGIWGVLLTTHPLLVPRSWKGRAIPLPTLWATPGL